VSAVLTPSVYQQAIYDWVRDGEGSAIINAVAGSGKTTTAIGALRHRPSTQESARYFAFNTDIAKELKTRTMGMPNVRASTFHAAGFGAVCRALGMQNVPVMKGRSKSRGIIWDWPNKRIIAPFEDFISELVELAKGEGLGAITPCTGEALMALVNHHDLSLDHVPAWKEEEYQRELQRGLLLTQAVIDRSNVLAREEYQIEFADMLYLPLLWDLQLPQSQWVIVDEAQDTNPVRRAIAAKCLASNGRLMAVGDPYQCQPPDALVEVADKPSRFSVSARRLIPIDRVRAGDFVSSYSLRDGRVYARKVLNVAERHHRGELITVSTTSRSSQYTPEHRCVTRFRKAAWCVYIMRRNRCFRVGVARATQQNLGAGPLLRLRAEDGDALWLIAALSSKRDALRLELEISAKYAIPGLMFTAKPTAGCLFTQAELDAIWASCDTETRGQQCLRDYGRLPHRPYFKRGQQQGTLRRPHLVEAVNLLEGSEVLTREGSWESIILTRRLYEGPVYSLEVEREAMYFADGILTHNSIYGFTGASIDAMHQLAAMFHTIELPLSVCYRCARLIVKEAQRLVPHILPADDAPRGEAERWGMRSIVKLTQEHAILCRNTAPLVQAALWLIKQGVGCRVLGSEIGRGLIKLVDRMKAETVIELETAFDEYYTEETERLESGPLAALKDRIDTVRTVIVNTRGLRSIPELKEALTRLFDDTVSGLLTLSTVHKAKGLEWPTVAILQPELMPSLWATLPWEQQQEANLEYVAITRARERLIWLEGKLEGQ